MAHLIAFFLLGFGIGYWDLARYWNFERNLKKWQTYVIKIIMRITKVVIIFILPYTFIYISAPEEPSSEFSAWSKIFISIWFLSGLAGLAVSTIVKKSKVTI